jgi:purine-binding chemotaxis protein CheW
MPNRTKKELSLERMEKRPETVEDMAHDEDDLYEREELKEETLQIIVFRLAREWYGVEITKVKEVIKVGKITYLPSSPEHIVGIVSLRGNILSVTDLKTIFTLPYEEPTEKTRIIAIESGMLETGLLVDEVIESIEVPISKIEPPLLTLPADGGRYVEGQCWTGKKLVALLNVEKILEKRV